MLRIHTRQFSCSAAVEAAAKKKAQGFAKAQSGTKAAAKRITPGSMYKRWQPAVATANLHKNATFVDLPMFNPNNISAADVHSFSEQQLQFLYRLGSFKQNQFNELFTRPISLVRDSTTRKLYEALRKSENKKLVLTGEPGVGKSTLLAQLHAHALENKGLVLTVSNSELLTNGRNDFFLDEDRYIQPMYIKNLLTKFVKSNKKELLQSIKLSKDYKLVHSGGKDLSVKRNVNLSAGKSTLYDLLSVKAPSRHRGAVFDAFIKELTNQTDHPVYFTVDNFSHLLTTPFTAYKDTSNKNIHILKFQVGQSIFDLVSGDLQFAAKDSCVVLATSGLDRTNRTLSIGLQKLPHDPYLTRYHYEQILAEKLLKGKVQEFEVTKLNKDEVAKLMEFYQKAGIVLDKDLQNKTFEQLTEEKYFLSGNGNPRELLKSITLYPF
ncbi:mitochondrial 37S ribosomal protein mS29 [Kluyveromyces lactis]|uniref:Small ribosomal subunit protein mS29 n=1 Tax=Kluyveromyces lactis (strain ATCC 8585 / CBS 2359 / DSM 70799 / NBRC 1267 / NRRL Y-1140 / WM37) TaxID=284590 RepID=Q6CWQ9_KLULA|nr:mitochondrial 37S ribosomal protein RSM23 [Kluyveromyces lactis]CAH02023.1 KLLA0B02222p [Kluyveromyces lactis]|eukprot:XP_451630.1 mitochondrial 37S ribosomal protein RSM23 [Kluyveromyces lactis]